MINLKKYRPRRRLIVLLSLFTFGYGMVGVMGAGFAQNSLSPQNLRPEEVATLVYKQIPDFPIENDYERVEGGKAENHTLISRFIRYHQFVKSRATVFRLDWKLTFADYLGVNETIQEERYPGYATLTKNPFSRDLQIITSLTREQREELINVLMGIYQPPTSPQSSSESLSPASSPVILPTGKGADLLR
ncbi:MAG: hypothetical protein IGQ45_10725 [Cyanobacterium sp. T60_A2020_053]|nr:hypothetical protein [Cyanobacterium sp. T60_A2020_053]